MLINLKNNFHWLLYVAGLCIYFVLLAQSTLTLSVIWLLFILYAWLIIAIVTAQYCFKHFLYVFCSSGIIVSLSLFFSYGIEQVPLPVGAILFKEEGILPAVLLLFVFSVPLIVYNREGFPWSLSTNQPSLQRQLTDPSDAVKDSIASEEWEEATIEDLESGSYEPA